MGGAGYDVDGLTLGLVEAGGRGGKGEGGDAHAAARPHGGADRAPRGALPTRAA